MANLASNIQPPSLDVSDFLSVGDRLGGKRIDNAIENARSSSIPIQGAQTGGYSPTYTHLSHIPLFPLYHSSQTIALQQQEARKQKKLTYVKPPMQQSAGTKLLFTVMTHLSGGANPMSMAKWENRLKGVGAVQMQKSMEQTHALVFTRWMVPPSSPSVSGVTSEQDIWFMDVLEWRGEHGAAVYAKTGKDRVSFQTLGKVVKEQKVGKTWIKRFLGGEKGKCEAVAWVKGVGEEVQMEIVARIQRPCARMEARASLKVFEKEWHVPVVAMG
ncbi:hypothetical protein EG329_010864 [Mollisiaceae sp. DMI_Dod_QoI]|nr:hypothetical protein EG329_010864 [Helotiales sp. DMI_Dod_QoI]